METRPAAHVQIAMSKTKGIVVFFFVWIRLSASRKTSILANTERSTYNIYKHREHLYSKGTQQVWCKYDLDSQSVRLKWLTCLPFRKLTLRLRPRIFTMPCMLTGLKVKPVVAGPALCSPLTVPTCHTLFGLSGGFIALLSLLGVTKMKRIPQWDFIIAALGNTGIDSVRPRAGTTEYKNENTFQPAKQASLT